MPKILRCPNSHKIGRKGPEGECTPIRCADPRTKATKDPDEPSTMLPLAQAKAVARGHTTEAEARWDLVKMPRGLEGPAAEAHVAKRIIDLTVFSLAELEYQLLHGADGRRYSTALEILDRAGFGKKGESGGGGSPVIVVNMGGETKLPWAQRVVDAKE